MCKGDVQNVNVRPLHHTRLAYFLFPPSSIDLASFLLTLPPFSSPSPPPSQRVQDAEWKLILPQCEEASYSAGEVIVAASNGPSNR